MKTNALSKTKQKEYLNRFYIVASPYGVRHVYEVKIDWQAPVANDSIRQAAITRIDTESSQVFPPAPYIAVTSEVCCAVFNNKVAVEHPTNKKLVLLLNPEEMSESSFGDGIKKIHGYFLSKRVALKVDIRDHEQCEKRTRWTIKTIGANHPVFLVTRKGVSAFPFFTGFNRESCPEIPLSELQRLQLPTPSIRRTAEDQDDTMKVAEALDELVKTTGNLKPLPRSKKATKTKRNVAEVKKKATPSPMPMPGLKVISTETWDFKKPRTLRMVVGVQANDLQNHVVKKVHDMIKVIVFGKEWWILKDPYEKSNSVIGNNVPALLQWKEAGEIIVTS